MNKIIKTKMFKLMIVLLLILFVLNLMDYINKKIIISNENTIDKQVIEQEVKDNLTQSEKQKIDDYNFSQLERVKSILGDNFNLNNEFYTLEEFNDEYETDIKPIKNCYYLSVSSIFKIDDKNYDNGVWYIFWFKLESEKYIEKYGGIYYAYPKYDIPKKDACIWIDGNLIEWLCYDTNIWHFVLTVSEPCKN